MNRFDGSWLFGLACIAAIGGCTAILGISGDFKESGTGGADTTRSSASGTGASGPASGTNSGPSGSGAGGAGTGGTGTGASSGTTTGGGGTGGSPYTACQQDCITYNQTGFTALEQDVMETCGCTNPSACYNECYTDPACTDNVPYNGVPTVPACLVCLNVEVSNQGASSCLLAAVGSSDCTTTPKCGEIVQCFTACAAATTTSSSASSSNASSSSTGGGCGSLPNLLPGACGSCITSNCCAEALACDGGSDCSSILQCTLAGGGDQACAAMYPGGVTAYSNLGTCAAGSCGLDCEEVCDSGITESDFPCLGCLSSSCCTEYEACASDINCFDCIQSPNPGCQYNTAYAAALQCRTTSCGTLCAGDTCSDGTQDGNETDSDCGGSDCQPCGPGQHCNSNMDCGTGLNCGTTGTCQASGGCTFDSDCPPPSSDCQYAQCSGGSCQYPNEPQGTTCTSYGGFYCNGYGACVQCTYDSDCGYYGQCITATCYNGFCSSYSEPDGSYCTDGGGVECIGGVCSGGNQCYDGSRDGNETDIDCGGICPLCGPGQSCVSNADCQTGTLCVYSICQNTACVDGVQDNGESDVDCGGTINGTGCPPCGYFYKCFTDADCQAGMACSAAYGSVCVYYCNDGVRDYDETDVDCGGPSCGARCSSGHSCISDSDCYSGMCQGGACL